MRNLRNPFFPKPKAPEQKKGFIDIGHLADTPSVYFGMFNENREAAYQLLFTPEQAEALAADLDRVAALARQWREANNA